MEDYKKFEAAVIRRACYMVNTLAINEDEFTRSFYFTNTLPFNKWYEKNACDSWILTSFYKAYRIFMEKKASAEGERKRLERDVLIPACAAINEVIDSQNEKTAYYYSEDFLIENVMESLAQQGYTYDYVQKRAREMAKDADFRRKFYDNIKEKINIPFEHQLGNPNAGSPLKFDASSLWQPIEKKYRHVTPRDIEYTSNTNQWTTTEDSLGLAGIDMKNFAEYQYVRALEDILHECFTNDDKVNALVEAGYSLRPELNDKCFPGAKWDILQTVWKDEPELEKDLVSLVHYCTDNQEPHIKESWLFQYAEPLPLDQTDEEKEAEELLVSAAKNSASVYIKTIVALVKCVQVNTLDVIIKAIENVAGDSSPDKKETSPTMAERMKKYGLSSYSFENTNEQEFLLDIIKIMQSDGIEIDTADMEKFLDKESTHYNTNKEEKANWKCVLVGWKRTLISAIFVVVGLKMISLDDSLMAAIAALLVGVGIYAYGVIKNIRSSM